MIRLTAAALSAQPWELPVIPTYHQRKTRVPTNYRIQTPKEEASSTPPLIDKAVGNNPGRRKQFHLHAAVMNPAATVAEKRRERGKRRKKRGFFCEHLRAGPNQPWPRKHGLISAYDGYVSRSETPTRPHSAPSTPIVRLIYVFSRVIRPPPWPTPRRRGSVAMATRSAPTPNRGAPAMSASALRSRGRR